MGMQPIRPKDTLECGKYFTLTIDEPQAILSTEAVDKAELEVSPICVSSYCTSSPECRITVDIGLRCPIQNLESCMALDVSPFAINGDYPVIDEWEKM
ncbi:unnamed protein product, partial [Mesorhabditis belari]